MASRNRFWRISILSLIAAFTIARLTLADEPEHRGFSAEQDNSSAETSSGTSGGSVGVFRNSGARAALAKPAPAARTASTVAIRSTGQRGAYRAPTQLGRRGFEDNRPDPTQGPATAKKPADLVVTKITTPNLAAWVDRQQTSAGLVAARVNVSTNPNPAQVRLETQLKGVGEAVTALSTSTLKPIVGPSTIDAAGVSKVSTTYKGDDLATIAKQVRVLVDAGVDKKAVDEVLAGVTDKTAKEFAETSYAAHTASFKDLVTKTPAEDSLLKSAYQPLLQARLTEQTNANTQIGGRFTAEEVTASTVQALKAGKNYDTVVLDNLVSQMRLRDGEQEAAIKKDLEAKVAAKTATAIEAKNLEMMNNPAYAKARTEGNASATAWNDTRRGAFDADGKPKATAYEDLMRNVPQSRLNGYTAGRFESNKAEENKAGKQMVSLAASKPAKDGDPRYLVFEKMENGKPVYKVEKYEAGKEAEIFKRGTEGGYSMKLPNKEVPLTEDDKKAGRTATKFEPDKDHAKAIAISEADKALADAEAAKKAATAAAEAAQAPNREGKTPTAEEAAAMMVTDSARVRAVATADAAKKARENLEGEPAK